MNSVKRFLQIAVFSVFFALVLAGFISVCGTTKASAAPEHELKCYYTSIQIEQGDTLWAIAEQYKSENESVQEYIDAVMEMNHLNSDQITAGKSLMIYYYVPVTRDASE